jgi:hypothetical protein
MIEVRIQGRGSSRRGRRLSLLLAGTSTRRRSNIVLGTTSDVGVGEDELRLVQGEDMSRSIALGRSNIGRGAIVGEGVWEQMSVHGERATRSVALLQGSNIGLGATIGEGIGKEMPIHSGRGARSVALLQGGRRHDVGTTVHREVVEGNEEKEREENEGVMRGRRGALNTTKKGASRIWTREKQLHHSGWQLLTTVASLCRLGRSDGRLC